MPPDTDHDQELSLKKRARRRLVGAVGLVLLMVGVLPLVLQDRASSTPSAAIKITMAGVDAGVVEPIAPLAPLAAPPLPTVSPLADAVSAASDSTAVAVNDSAASAVPAQIKPTEKPTEKAIEKPLEAKPLEAKAPEAKSQLATPALAKAEGGAAAKSSFAIQIGVYSSMASVTEMEGKLKQAGYQASIKKVSTDRGEKIRLRTGDYPTRQQAAEAMLKLQALNMQGMVVAND
ncbi:cell division protein DedD [Methylophilaceae bacterium]